MGKSLPNVDVAEGVVYETRCRVIEGVVSPAGTSGWPGEGYGVHCFALAAWRPAGGTLVGSELTVLRPVPLQRDGQSFDSAAFGEVPAYSIQRFSVLLTRDHRRAVVEKWLPAERRDNVLIDLSERLQRPVVVTLLR